MSLPPDPLSDGLAAYGQRLRDGSLTIEAAVRACLRRIEALDPALHAYCWVAADAAIETARVLDRQLRAGVDRGSLMGVPVGVKDNIMVADMPCRVGSATDAADRMHGEADFVARLKAAGCIVLGKLHTVEFALGNTGVNLRCATPRNPWDADKFRVPSGSSSGSAVAVAAGLCGFAVGTDTGGSVRGPAAHCGVVGMKYTGDRWPMAGVFPVSGTLDALGVLTRSARDAAVVWAALAGEAPVAAREPSRIRLGLAHAYFFDDLDATVDKAMNQALDTLARHALRPHPVDVAGLREVDVLYNVISKAELYAYLGAQWVQDQAQAMNADVYDRLSEAATFADGAYADSLSRRNALARAAAAVFERVDALVSPTKREVAPVFDVDASSVDDMRQLSRRCAGPTRAVNFYDWCAVSLPLTTERLPVGLQLMGPRDGERGVLEVALALERLLGESRGPDLARFV